MYALYFLIEKYLNSSQENKRINLSKFTFIILLILPIGIVIEFDFISLFNRFSSLFYNKVSGFIRFLLLNFMIYVSASFFFSVWMLIIKCVVGKKLMALIR